MPLAASRLWVKPASVSPEHKARFSGGSDKRSWQDDGRSCRSTLTKWGPQNPPPASSANEFHDEVAAFTKYGRVLVLLDACHSGAVTGDGSTLISNAELLRRTMADSNVTVLTSSTANEFSLEDDKWNNGAFTRALLDALGKDGDEDHDGLISMSELTHYLSTHVISLTGGQQHPGIEQRFEGELFIAGP